jgi:hypothetical protein
MLRIRRGYDWVSIAIIILFFALLFRIRAQLPIFSDSWYHLSVIRAFSERGIGLHAWWEFAPFGRPHLYPPLFHVVNLAVLRATSLGLLDLARLYDVVTFPLVLAAGWLAARNLFGAKAAFLTLLLLSLNIGLLFSCSLIMMPATYALLLWPFLHIFVLRKHWLVAALLLSAIGYIHFGAASVAAASLLILSLFKKEYLRPSLLAMAVAIAIYSPWLAHLYQNREFLHSGMAKLPIFIPVFTLVGAILGIVAAVRNPEKESLAVLSMMLASCVFLFTLRERFWTYGGFLFAILGGYGIERCASRHIKAAILILIVSCASITPFLKPPRMKLALPMPFQTTPFIAPTPFLALAHWQNPEAAAKISAAVPPEINALAKWIAENVAEDEVILTNDRLLGGCIFPLTGRKTTSGLWSEITTAELKTRLTEHYRTARGYLIVNTNNPEEIEFQGETRFVTSFGRYSVFYRPP